MPIAKTDYIDPGITFLTYDISPGYFKIIFDHGFLFYSVLNAFTGFANAALIACELTVINAINKAIAPAARISTNRCLSGMQNPAAICSLPTRQMVMQLQMRSIQGL